MFETLLRKRKLLQNILTVHVFINNESQKNSNEMDWYLINDYLSINYSIH